MRCNTAKANFFLVVSGCLSHQLPKSILCAIINQVMVNIVCFQIQSCFKYCLYDRVGLRLFDANNRTHDSKVHLNRGVDGRHIRDLCPAIFGVEKLPIPFDQITHTLTVKQMHFWHPLRNQIRTILFSAVQLNIQEPVVLQLFVGNWTVNNIVSIGIVMP